MPPRKGVRDEIMARQWILFHCSKDDDWIVCRLDGDVALGVADCPDERTARAIMEAMRARDSGSERSSDEVAITDVRLSARAGNILHWYTENGYGPDRKRIPIKTVKQLAAHTRCDLLVQRNCGKVTLREYEQLLVSHGLSFRHAV